MINLAEVIRNVPDFPKPGIQFKDITTLLLHPDAYKQAVDALKARYAGRPIDAIAAVESRGFVFGAALAYVLGVPLILARKPGKLPAETISESFALEYGTDAVQMHVDAVGPGMRVLIVDDLLATGGTAAAVARLVRRLGGEVAEAAFVVELPLLGGRGALAGIPVHALVEFMVE